MKHIVYKIYTKSTLESSQNQEDVNQYCMISGIWEVKIENYLSK